MPEKPLQTKSVDFGVRIVKLAKYLRSRFREWSLADQILRSGTSIGANVAESECASSEKDFLNKIYIALKECCETKYWIIILAKSGFINKVQYESLMSDCVELQKLMRATTKTMRGRLGSQLPELEVVAEPQLGYGEADFFEREFSIPKFEEIIDSPQSDNLF